MAKYIVTNIEWDVDGEEEAEEILASLPTQMTVEIDENEVDDINDESEIADLISDKITDETAFCNKGFTWMPENDNRTTTHIVECTVVKV